VISVDFPGSYCRDAVSAYVLFLNEIVPQDATLDADNLAKIKMPNRDGFISAYPSAGGATRR